MNKNKRKGTEIHHRHRLFDHHYAIKHTRNQRDHTNGRKISRRKQERNEIHGENIGKHRVQQRSTKLRFLITKKKRF